MTSIAAKLLAERAQSALFDCSADARRAGHHSIALLLGTEALAMRRMLHRVRIESVPSLPASQALLGSPDGDAVHPDAPLMGGRLKSSIAGLLGAPLDGFTAVSLSWILPGASCATPLDKYILVIAIEDKGLRGYFFGPSGARNKPAVSLRSSDTSSTGAMVRWVGMFTEWALSTAEGR